MSGGGEGGALPLFVRGRRCGVGRGGREWKTGGTERDRAVIFKFFNFMSRAACARRGARAYTCGRGCARRKTLKRGGVCGACPDGEQNRTGKKCAAGRTRNAKKKRTHGAPRAVRPSRRGEKGGRRKRKKARKNPFRTERVCFFRKKFPF